MEVDVTHLWKQGSRLRRFSDSIAQSGRQDIGKITWTAAQEEARVRPLVKAEDQDTLRDWIREFGAWDDAEVSTMSDMDTNALLIQFVAGDCLEYLEHHDPEQVRLFFSEDQEQVFFYIDG